MVVELLEIPVEPVETLELPESCDQLVPLLTATGLLVPVEPNY